MSQQETDVGLSTPGAGVWPVSAPGAPLGMKPILPASCSLDPAFEKPQKYNRMNASIPPPPRELLFNLQNPTQIFPFPMWIEKED